MMKSPAGRSLLLHLTAVVLALNLSACFKTLSEAELSDAGIKARIEAQLRAQRELDLRYVTIDVHSRVVTVSGLVPTWEDKQTVERIVRDTRGVDQALINLAIQE